MKVLVTGANGLLATNIIKLLLESDEEVIGFLRNKNNFALPDHRSLRLVEGDITKPSTYRHLLSSVDCIIHVAALTGQNIIDYAKYDAVNNIATKEIYEGAIENKVEQFIYVSTANCFGYGSLAEPGDESIAIRAPFSKSLYAKSKLAGQNNLLEIAKNEETTKLVILNPTFMIGAYDTKPSSGRLVLSAYKKRVIFYPPGGKSFINVKDAAVAVINAIRLGKHRQYYILSGENLSYLDFYKKVTLQLHQKSFFIPIPKYVLYAVGCFGNMLRFFKIQTDISITNVKTLCVNNYYSNRKAVDQLKLPKNPIEHGIDEAIEWFKLK
ncbi:NAD-dependent epimerase/dehydratase family protein [Tenacibaculum sp. SG-28]|uniref:NAD-dependent epimerase/dehydratase family protein n=1 Tax=Tenacibaculum sp. SG-28 TaxID=754426 RepID=UPI000CF50F16|nr:NAD-dependent epimerase/dehydratase family protein [Tenacibaculum sp. SG-28]PQJ20728.1 hypothetical protein BSU00_10575 [Tenacibaculum sp. SG-28]